MAKVLGLVKDKVMELKLDNVRHSHITWIDCFNPSKEELRKISLLTKIPYLELNERLVEDERPVTYEINGYTLVIFRAPSNKPRIITTTIAAFISNRFIVTIRTDDLDSVRRIKEYDEIKLKNKFKAGPAAILHTITEEIMKSFFNIIDKIEDQIEKLEDNVFKKPERRLAEKIFTIRKKMIYFHKALVANKEVALMLQKGGVKHIPVSFSNKFRDIVYDLQHAIDLETTFRDILTSTLDVYLSAVSNSQNQIMKTLTVIASFVLVPTWITGIYGMNFRFMPEIEWEYGYLFSWTLMIFSIVAMLYYFKRRRWI